MEVVSNHEMVRREEEVFASGLTPAALMEKVGEEMADRVRQIYPQAQEFLILVGKGNNGGDGLVMARHLALGGCTVRVVLAAPDEPFIASTQTQLNLWRDLPAQVESWESDLPFPDNSGVVIDALLGLQARRPLRGVVREIVARLNQARAEHFFRTVALDFPSGLAGYEGSEVLPERDAAVVADVTLAVGFAKEVLCREALAGWVGRLEVLPWAREENLAAEKQTLGPEKLAHYLPRRNALSFKNNYGRLVIVAGSPGFSGAAVLCAQAGLAMGAGLVSVLTQNEAWPIVAAHVPPEIMVSPWPNSALLGGAAAVVIGPGLGEGEPTRDMLRSVLEIGCPVLIDADGLNVLAQNLTLLEKSQGPVLLTPHPGEMARLIGRKFALDEREAVARTWVERYPGTLILKGVRTLVTQPGKPIFYNTTGNPGLSTGGSGDTLAGLIGALLAQKLEPLAAAQLGVWLHGHAADLLLRERSCEEGMTATELSAHLGAALTSLRGGKRGSSLIKVITSRFSR